MTDFVLSDDLQKFVDEVNAVSKELWEKNTIAQETKNFIKNQLDNVEISTEDRDKLYLQFIEQLGIGLIAQAQNIVLNVPVINKSKFEELQALAVLHKQHGYGNATSEELGESTGDGLIDEQIKGFVRNDATKVLGHIAGVQQMLAQNDIPVPQWQVDVMKLAIEMATNGKIDIKNNAGADTTVKYNKDATEPNGLEA